MACGLSMVEGGKGRFNSTLTQLRFVKLCVFSVKSFGDLVGVLQKLYL